MILRSRPVSAFDDDAIQRGLATHIGPAFA